MYNLTPHKLVIYDRETGEQLVEPTHAVARAVGGDQEQVTTIRGYYPSPCGTGTTVRDIPVVNPPQYTGVDYGGKTIPHGSAVVVSIVAAPLVVADRPDLMVLTPDQSPGSVVRDAEGNILGVHRLILWSRPQRVVSLCHYCEMPSWELSGDVGEAAAGFLLDGSVHPQQAIQAAAEATGIPAEEWHQISGTPELDGGPPAYRAVVPC